MGARFFLHNPNYYIIVKDLLLNFLRIIKIIRLKSHPNAPNVEQEHLEWHSEHSDYSMNLIYRIKHSGFKNNILT